MEEKSIEDHGNKDSLPSSKFLSCTALDPAAVAPIEVAMRLPCSALSAYLGHCRREAAGLAGLLLRLVTDTVIFV